MPSGGRRVQFGDKCKNCGVEIQKYNAKYTLLSSHCYLNPKCKLCFEAGKRKNYKYKYEGYSLNAFLKCKYGISLDEFNRRNELQFGGCAICKQPCKSKTRLSVDHDHKTGRVRDLICNRCNVVLGYINEDEQLLFAMIEYLKRHEEKLAS